MFCELCQRHVPPGPSHLNGKKHLAQVAIQRRREDFSGRSIFVTGFPRGTLELQLTDYFSQFGPVSKIIFDKNKGQYAIVEFASKVTQEMVLRQQYHIMGRSILTVKERTMKKKSPNFETSSVSGQNDFTEFNCLREIPTVVEQMVKLLELISQTENELRWKEQLRKRLEQIFNDFYPGCSIQIYGSSASGYGFKGCDLDLHFTLPDSGYLGASSEPPLIEEVKRGLKTLINLTLVGHLKFSVGLLKKYGPSCVNIIFINARCPIIRFVHKATATPCDMSCNRGLSIHNTRLLRLYGELDSRTHLLIMTLRFWAKRRNLLGSGKKFTSYAFTLIIIFYLQTRQPAVAPSVEYLASLAGEKRIAEGWDCSFCEDPDLIPKTGNQETLDDLLKGFFHYYCTFDFTMNAICPRLGHTIPQTTLPELRKPYTIAVQDPFNLSHVVTGTISGQHLIHFLENLEAASKICNDKDWGLHDLLLGDVQKMIPLTNAVVAANSIEIPLDPEVLCDLFDVHRHTEAELKKMWLDKVSWMVIDILRKGLLFTCCHLDVYENDNDIDNESFVGNPTEQQKTEVDDDEDIQETDNTVQNENRSFVENPTKQLKQNTDSDTCSNRQEKDDMVHKRVYVVDNERSENPAKRLKLDIGSDIIKQEILDTDSGNLSNNNQRCVRNDDIIETDYTVDTQNYDSNLSTEQSPDGDSRLLHVGHFRVFTQAWNGRRNEVKGIILDEGATHCLDREEQISRRIMKYAPIRKKGKPRVEFKCSVFGVQRGVVTLLQVFFQCKTGPGEFKAMVAFLKKYIPKIVNANFAMEAKVKRERKPMM